MEGLDHGAFGEPGQLLLRLPNQDLGQSPVMMVLAALLLANPTPNQCALLQHGTMTPNQDRRDLIKSPSQRPQQYHDQNLNEPQRGWVHYLVQRLPRHLVPSRIEPQLLPGHFPADHQLNRMLQ